MNGYFIALLVIYVLSLGIELAKNGQVREGKHSFGVSSVTIGILLTLIYMAIKTGF